MTQPPAGWQPAAPPTAAPTAAAAPPPVPPTDQPVPAPRVPWARPPAWRKAVRRVRAAATTEPGRLRGIATLLALLLLSFGALTSWQVSARATAAESVAEQSQPLSENAAALYRSLADADTTAATGFLAGGDEPRAMRQRYERSIRRAAETLAEAAANTEGSQAAHRRIAVLNRELARYTGLVEAARANNRQGLPLGGAYLRYANQRMQEKLLPAARDLHRAESGRLRSDYVDARAWPWLATVAGVLTLGVLGWAQRRHYRRTNRVLSPGLVGATAATLLALLWLTTATALARSSLGESDERGSRSLQVLNEAWTGALQARGAESMWLVARGAGGAYEQRSAAHLEALTGASDDQRGGGGGLLGKALTAADDRTGRAPVEEARTALGDWRERHARAKAAEDAGDYDSAVALVIGNDDTKTTADAFDRVDAALRKASAHEQSEFEDAAADGRAALTGLAPGVAVLAVAGAAAALQGVGRRLAEYR